HGPGWLWPWPRRPGMLGVRLEARRGATGSSRECHGSVTEVPRRGVVRPLPNGQESAVFLIRPYDGFRTPQALRCSLLGHAPGSGHRRRSCGVPLFGMAELSNTARICVVRNFALAEVSNRGDS